jgi:mono/diheme cytochrome c family protein
MRRLKLSWARPGFWLALPLMALLTSGMISLAVQGQEDDMLDFVPPGGRTLVSELLAAGAPLDTVTGVLAEDRDAAGWLDWIDANRAAVPGLDGFDEYQARTLANYLAHVTPLDKTGLGGDALADQLPRDGRDMALRYCQSCHIITVSITQDRTREAWLSTLNNPSHVEIDMSREERSLLADYYVVNGAIPIEQVPPALRAGGASY